MAARSFPSPSSSRQRRGSLDPTGTGSAGGGRGGCARGVSSVLCVGTQAENRSLYFLFGLVRLNQGWTLFFDPLFFRSREGGYSGAVAIHSHMKKHGLVVETATSETAEGVAAYLESKGARVPAERPFCPLLTPRARRGESPDPRLRVEKVAARVGVGDAAGHRGGAQGAAPRRAFRELRSSP